jgi:hypothetical protein
MSDCGKAHGITLTIHMASIARPEFGAITATETTDTAMPRLTAGAAEAHAAEAGSTGAEDLVVAFTDSAGVGHSTEEAVASMVVEEASTVVEEGFTAAVAAAMVEDSFHIGLGIKPGRTNAVQAEISSLSSSKNPQETDWKRMILEIEIFRREESPLRFQNHSEC